MVTTACFVTPAIVATLTTILQLINKRLASKLNIKLLNMMLWGGTILLAVEHVLHGEVMPYPPFLTAAYSLEGMLHEVSIIGTSMTLAVTTLWGGIVGISKLYSKACTARKFSKFVNTLNT